MGASSCSGSEQSTSLSRFQWPYFSFQTFQRVAQNRGGGGRRGEEGGGGGQGRRGGGEETATEADGHRGGVKM